MTDPALKDELQQLSAGVCVDVAEVEGAVSRMMTLSKEKNPVMAGYVDRSLGLTGARKFDTFFEFCYHEIPYLNRLCLYDQSFFPHNGDL